MTSSEQLDLGDAAIMLTQVSTRMEHLEAVDREHHRRRFHLTDRLFDEAQPSGERTYMHAFQSISSAWENYEAVFHLLSAAGGATPWAPYSLVRPAFESSFFALWALDPADGRTRRLRGLTLAAIDNREHGNWVDELCRISELDSTVRERMKASISRARKVYRNEATQLGVGYEKVAQRPNLIDQLRKLEQVKNSEPIIEHTLVAAWRQLSGYQHGHAYAIMSGADRTVEAKIPGGVIARVTINDQHFGLTMQLTALLLLWAMDAYIRRTSSRTP